MKKLTAIAVTLCLLPTPSFAQMAGKRGGGENKKAEHKAPAIDEKAYKAALERIPEPKEKYDPWGQMRPAPPAKK
jgi:hypothetical protein